MRISDDQIDEFITTWESAFNERLRRDDAKTKAAELLKLFSLLRNGPLEEMPSRPATMESRGLAADEGYQTELSVGSNAACQPQSVWDN